MAGPFGIGVAAGVAAAAGVRFGRRAVIRAKVGTGHPLKHRVLRAVVTDPDFTDAHYDELKHRVLDLAAVPCNRSSRWTR